MCFSDSEYASGREVENRNERYNVQEVFCYNNKITCQSTSSPERIYIISIK